MQIVQRHHFASHLKRMAVVVRIEDEFLAFVKVCWLQFSFGCSSYTASMKPNTLFIRDSGIILVACEFIQTIV